KLCIEVSYASKVATIFEELCIGCGICVKKCPFDAIEIINLPKDLEKDTTHRYGVNTFKLHSGSKTRLYMLFYVGISVDALDMKRRPIARTAQASVCRIGLPANLLLSLIHELLLC
ncbi:ABC transporter E family member 2, partial [Tanacetum coccineum]